MAYLVLLVLKEICGSRYSLKTVFAAIVVFGLLLVVNGSLPGMFQFGTSLVLIYCARDVSLEKIMKVTVWPSSAWLAFVALNAYAGMIENYKTVTSARTRSYRGFR